MAQYRYDFDFYEKDANNIEALDAFRQEVGQRRVYDIESIIETVGTFCKMYNLTPRFCGGDSDTHKLYLSEKDGSLAMIVLLRVDNSDFMNDHNLLMEFASKFHESKVQLFDRILNESIYARGFKSSGMRGPSIFGLIKDIKEYVADMDRDEAIEEAVYAAVDYVKDGNL